MNDQPTETRHDVRCSCGKTWPQCTKAEADRICFEHDDHPYTEHIVSSPTAWLHPKENRA